MSILHRLLRQTHATALIEFALLAPVLIVLLLGILGYGQYIFAAHTLQQMANDAARSAIVGQTPQSRDARARTNVAQALARAPLGAAGSVVTAVGEADGRIAITLTADTRELAMMLPTMVPMPQPVIERRAVAEIAALP